MTMSRAYVHAVALCAFGLCAQSAHAQSIASRIAAVKEGTVEVRFAGRSGLCGDGLHYLSFGGNTRIGEFTGDIGRNGFCVPGPVRVQMRVEDGAVRNIRTYVGPFPTSARNASIIDLGVIPARDAASYFLDLAARGDGEASTKATLAAVVADSVSVWRPLLAIARDGSRRRPTRTDAAFWVSKFATAKLLGHPEDLGTVEDEERKDDDPRTSAVFALSQLRNGEGIAPLVQVARTNRDARLRGQALFWLGQTGDPRGLDVMEEILAR